MIQVKFVNKVDSKKATWVGIAIDGKSSSHIPEIVLNPLLAKPHGIVMEAFFQIEGALKQFVATKLKSDHTKIEREEAGAAIYQKALEGNARTLVIDIRQIGFEGLDLLTGIILSSWRFDKYRSQVMTQETPKIEQLLVLCDNTDETEQQFSRYQSVIEGVFYARALTSEPANILYPEAYALKLMELETIGIDVQILDAEALEAMGFSALLAVAQGSARKPAVVVMTWRGANAINEQPIVIVGKGVCFDSGGLCLKPAAHQLDMKWDKAGASVVAGLMKTLALQNFPEFAIGIVGLVENMPDGNAMKPGDIIQTMSGQTVEIVNTDAEGRLVLADCLWYAEENFNPRALIDLGTLTAETIASLGTSHAAAYTNSNKLILELKEAGMASGDLLWELPMGLPFAKQIESEVADMKNMGIEMCGENGAAAEFLKKYIRNVPWVHIDIASVSWTKEHLPLCCKGATGFGVRLLEEWLHKWGRNND